MKLIILCAVLGMALSDSVPEATAFASAGTSYKYDLPGGYASFSAHTPYAAAHVMPIAPMEKDKAYESEDKKEYEKPESAPYIYPFLKDYPMADKNAKVPVVYTYPFQYKLDDKRPVYYVQSAFAQTTSDKAKEDTSEYKAEGEKMEKHEMKTPLVYTHPFYLNFDPSMKTEEKKQVYYYTFPGFKPESEKSEDEKKQVYYYTYPFPGYKPDSSEKSEEKKQVYSFPHVFPVDYKFDASPDKTEEKKQIYYYPSTFPATYKLESSDKSDEKKPLYYYPYTFPITSKFDSAEKSEIKTPFVYSSSPYYYPKTESTYKLPTYYSPQYYYYHSY